MNPSEFRNISIDLVWRIQQETKRSKKGDKVLVCKTLKPQGGSSGKAPRISS